jgi:Flp pilus assembly protein TadD
MFSALVVVSVVVAQPLKPGVERVEVARAGWSQSLARMQAGAGTVDAACEWSRRLYESEQALDASTFPLKAQIVRLRSLEVDVQARVNAGTATQEALLRVKYDRLEAEERLLAAGEKLPPSETGLPAGIGDKAKALYKQEKYAEACPLFDQIAAASPKTANAWNDVAICRFHLGDSFGALQATTKALALGDEKDRANACYNLSKLAPNDPLTQASCVNGKPKR